MIGQVSVARLKVMLDDVAPPVMRRIVVPLTIRLDRLHLVLQAAIGWTDSHLYEFRFGDTGFGIPDPDWGDGPLDARKTTLRAALLDTGRKSFRYLYDFGDGWEHSIKVEKIDAAITDIGLPLLVAATGRCPPEDVGGPPGYAEFLEAANDPTHEQHEDVRRWVGATFDPNLIDTAAIDQALEALGRRWSRRKT